MKQSYFNYNFEPNFSLDNYFVGQSNNSAFKHLIQHNFNNNLLLLGPKKSGKTHLAKMWKNKFNASLYTNNLDTILNQKKNVLIDDLFIGINEEDIFHIINHSSLYNLKILITSNLEINEYLFKLNDLSSRLKTFYNLRIDLPDDELLVNLMIKLLYDKQIIIKNPDILNYILKRVNRSYEKVFQLIDKIDKLLMQTNKQLTIPLIKELI